MTDGYMAEDEFKHAVEEIALEVYGNIYGPVDFDKLNRTNRTSTKPPQCYRGVEIKTRQDIKLHIGSMYLNSVADNRGCLYMGKLTEYKIFDSLANFPQFVHHPIFGEKQINTVWDATPRKLGIHLLCITKNECDSYVRKFVSLWKFKHDLVLRPMPKEIDEKDAILVPNIHPALNDFINASDVTKLMEIYSKSVIEKYNQWRQKQMEVIQSQLAELEADMIAALEKIVVEPKFISSTNLADIPICAKLE